MHYPKSAAFSSQKPWLPPIVRQSPPVGRPVTRITKCRFQADLPTAAGPNRAQVRVVYPRQRGVPKAGFPATKREGPGSAGAWLASHEDSQQLVFLMAILRMNSPSGISAKLYGVVSLPVPSLMGPKFSTDAGGSIGTVPSGHTR